MEPLEQIALELKEFLRQYDEARMLGDLTQMFSMIANGMARDQLEKLSSPQRQMYYIAGLLLSAEPKEDLKIQYSPEDWEYIVEKLNAIEAEYYKLFWPQTEEEVTEKWKRDRQVALPSFFSYFNQGTLNFEEQVIAWIRELYTQLDTTIEGTLGLKTEDFLNFYESMDAWCQNNFRMLSQTADIPLRANWKEYARIEFAENKAVPEEIRAIGKEYEPRYMLVADGGIKNRFYPSDLVTDALPIEKVKAIIGLLSCKRQDRDYLYYACLNPGNPLFDTPIVDIGKGMYQVFEEKQVLHAIDNLLEKVCCQTEVEQSKFTKKKGDLLEEKTMALMNKFFKGRATIYQGYYVDGCEQDILVLYRDMALVVEAKAYTMHEPFRDPSRAYVRIKRDFDKSVGCANEQLWRVEKRFVEQKPLVLTDKDGKVIAEIDTTKYADGDFYIIVNQKSFGQIQTDLSVMLKLEEGAHYPWAVRYDDLEVFLLMLMRRKKDWLFLKRFLLDREYLHGRVFCSDELEICGGYLTGDITEEEMQGEDAIVTVPEMAAIFDEQYRMGMGFKDEKYWKEKKDGRTLFW